MIAITAYTEHHAPFIVSEQPQEFAAIAAGEENEEQSGFAELLAGILQNVSPEDDSEDSLDALSVEKNKDGNKLNLFSNALENDINLKDFDIDLSDAAIDKAYQLLSRENAEYLAKLYSETEIPAEDVIDMPQFDVNILNLTAELTAKTDLSFAAKTTETKTDAQAQNAANFTKDALDAAGRKAVAENQSPVTEAKNANTEAITKTGSSAENSNFLNNKEGKPDNFENPVINEKFTLSESPGRSRKDRFSLEVRDFRAAANRTDANNHNALADTAAKIPGQAGGPEITLDLRLPDFGPGSHAQTTWEVKAGNALENMLARELHQNFNGDIVRHASMALRDGGAGTIKIALHPETLGNVKIHLEMAENKITGLIIVESEEALNAFRREIAALEQAFRDSGFADASLDLSLTADESGNQEPENDALMHQIAASSYEDSYESEIAPIVDVFFGRRAGSVNMLA